MNHDHVNLSVYQTQRLKDKNGAIRAITKENIARSLHHGQKKGARRYDEDDFEQDSRDLIRMNQLKNNES